ncbi:hypothetical protein VLK81_01290 [Citroniella saccharovorans]|uniref:Alpha-ribazole kinase n=1 Tax=Citroniella saccharovorans TaxID=2053367 RepID=A0AAW9MRR4_9FIRM|nr:hypothetical protein [Citroniella saccharovorans]MEB3428671.1 hypothetical protein [Citroniella saccharovorans]
MTRVYRYRDLSIIDFGEMEILIACDSLGSIGEKKLDLVKTKNEIAGYYEARVVLMELISQGGEIKSLVNAVCNEWNPTGAGIKKGIERALKEINLDPNLVLNGSTEENFETSMTALGIMGVATRKKKSYYSKSGEIVLALGKRLLGEDVVKDGGSRILSLNDLIHLRKMDYISELLPVGSKGINYEISKLEENSGLKAEIYDSKIDKNLSCGPSTVVLASLKEEDIKKLDFLDIDKEIVAKFI